METIREDSKVILGNKEEWIVKYFKQVFHPKTGKYCKAARVPSKKEIWLSTEDEKGNKYIPEKAAEHFQIAAAPIVRENVEKEQREKNK